MSTGAIRIYNWPPNLTAHNSPAPSSAPPALTAPGSSSPVAPGIILSYKFESNLNNWCSIPFNSIIKLTISIL